jgi:hypothetical protein
VYALAASPAGQAALRLAQEEQKTKGFRALFGVILMFGLLCGGVWLLLQSSFGPKQAYLITGTAFWGCWLVLSVLWLTGVPGLTIGPMHIPRSTPQYYGPQGTESTWQVIDTTAEKAAHPVDASRLIEATPDITNQAFLTEKSAAETAATEVAPEQYAEELGVGKADVTVPGVVMVAKTEVIREGGRLTFARVTFGPAEPNATDSETTKALIAKIKPKSVDLYFKTGTLAQPTYYAIGLFTLLFLLHLVGLVAYELANASSPKVAPAAA